MSLMRKLALLLFVALALAPSAQAQEGPERAALDFLTAIQSEDYDLLCSVLSSRLVTQVAEEGDCADTLRDNAREERDRARDQQALEDLEYAWQAALYVADERGGKHKCFVRKGFTASRLARAMEKLLRDKLEKRLDVRIGGARAARNTPAGVVVLDARATGCARLTLFVETASGKILRLRGSGLDATTKVEQVANGVAEPVKEEPLEVAAYAVLEVALGSSVAYVRLYQVEDPEATVTLRLVLEGTSYKVDDLFVSLIG